MSASSSQGISRPLADGAEQRAEVEPVTDAVPAEHRVDVVDQLQQVVGAAAGLTLPSPQFQKLQLRVLALHLVATARAPFELPFCETLPAKALLPLIERAPPGHFSRYR
jgi:hypothetical protein